MLCTDSPYQGQIFDPCFSESSFGFRPGRSAHDGIRQVKRYIEQGCTVAVDMDLSKFFDKVNHDVLMDRVSRRIKDKRVLQLIGKYLRAGVMVKGRLQATPMAVPQGGLCKALHKVVCPVLFCRIYFFIMFLING